MRDLQMEHLAGKPRTLGDLDQLANGLHYFLALATDVARVNSAILCGYFRDLHQLVRRAVRARRINQSGRHAHGTGAHRGVHDGAHTVQLSRVRRTRLAAEDWYASLGFAEVGSEVDADPLLLECREVLGDLASGDGRSAFTADGSGHALSQLVLSEPVHPEHAPRLVHHVDPARRNVFAFRVDLRNAAACHGANPYEAAVPDPDVGQYPRISGAIEHAAAADDDIV